MIRRLALLFLPLVLLAAACVDDASLVPGESLNLEGSSSEASEDQADDLAADTSVPESLALPVETESDDEGVSETEAVETEAVETDATARLLPGPVAALITPTGIVLPVIDDVFDGYLVMSPCGEETTVSWGTPLYSAEVVLDPGHGGDVETGAQGPNGLVEKDLNLQVAKHTALVLTERGVDVVLTRTADYRIPLAVRAEIGNRLEARMMVSIHHNAPIVQSSVVPGTEVFVQSGSAESRRLGGLIWEEVVDALSQFDVPWVAARDAGALAVINRDGEDSYGMVRRPQMPAVLAELGYIANPAEAALFESDVYVRVVSIALADAIERWLDTSDPGSGFSDEPRTFTPNGSTGHSRGCVDPPLE